MGFVGLIIALLALGATVWGVYYARQQLNEAERIRKESQRLFEGQRTEDDLWSEKYVRATTILCAVAPRFIMGSANRPSGDALGLLFPDPSLRNQVLSHLIEHKSGLVYVSRPFNVSQLRLQPMRELIDTVLNRFVEFRTQDDDVATRIGLP